jgi:hypothetical protein
MKLNPEHVFTVGKYKGKTIEEVLEIDSDYISWCQNEAPHLLEPYKKNFYKNNKPTIKFKQAEYENKEYKEPEVDKIESPIKPNYNFDSDKYEKNK